MKASKEKDLDEEKASPCLRDCLLPITKLERSFAYVFKNYEKVGEKCSSKQEAFRSARLSRRAPFVRRNVEDRTSTNIINTPLFIAFTVWTSKKVKRLRSLKDLSLRVPVTRMFLQKWKAIWSVCPRRPRTRTTVSLKRGEGHVALVCKDRCTAKHEKDLDKGQKMKIACQ